MPTSKRTPLANAPPGRILPSQPSSAAGKRRGYRPGVLSGQALALVLLGWSLLRVIARLLFTRQTPGLEQFHENYGSEGLTAIDPDERELLARFSGCVACGRCDVGEQERIRTSAGAYPGLMQLVLASTRSMPDYDAAVIGFDHVPAEVLRTKVRRCPVRIPFVELADFVRRRAADAQGSAVPAPALEAGAEPASSQPESAAANHPPPMA